MFNMDFKSFPPHFSKAELTNTSTGLPNVPSSVCLGHLRSLAWVLESIRSHVGKPLIINSAYRSREVNARVGGVNTSFHLVGSAADISIRNLNPHDRAILEEQIVAHHACEFIKYDTFWHVAFDFSRLAISRMPLTFQEEFPDCYVPLEVLHGSEDVDL